MESLIGKTLKNRYKVEESLGRGGMADVYKVWDEERAVYLAMKVLRQDLAQDPIFLRRFQREAKALASLQHPNIVRFYGLERDDLLAFLLMEYVDGVSLQAEILRSEGKPLPMEHIQEVMDAVCSALHYAHHQGLVHCDIKPGNILIDKHGHIYLTDFGIARGMDAATSTMVGVGTPAYMAPELIKGQDPTPQTDIYALGIVLYEMLTGGERPFTGERAEITGTTAEKVRWEHLELEPIAVSYFNSKVSKEIENIVMRCIEKRVQLRYQNVDSIWNEFKGCSITLQNTSESKGKNKEGSLDFDEINVLDQNKINESHSLKTQKKSDTRKNKTHTVRIIISVALIALGIIAGKKQGLFNREQDQSLIQPTLQKEFIFENISKENIQNLGIYKTMGYGEIKDVVYSPQDEMVIVGTGGGIYVLDPITLEINLSYQSQETDGGIVDIDISSQGTKLAVAYSDGRIVIIDPKDFTLISELIIPNTEITNIKLSHDENLIACSTSDFRVDLWDIDENSRLQEFSGFGDTISDIAFSMDDQLMATSSHDGNVIVWNLVSYQQMKTFYDLQYGAVAVEFSPDSTSLAMAENIGKIFIYDINGWSLKNEIETEHQGTLFDLNFSHDGKKLVSCSLDGSIRIWDSEDGELLNLIDKHENYVTSVDFSFDDSTIVSGSLDGTVRTWDAQSGEQKREKSGFLDFFNFIYPIQNTDTFFSSFGNGDLGVWRTDTFTRELILDYPRYFLSALGFSEDGEEVAFENGDNILLASMEDDYISHSFEGFKSAVYALAISPDKKMLAAGGYDQIVKVYDIETEVELYEFSFWDESVEYLEFSPDGNQLLVIYNDLLVDVNLETYESDDSMYLMEFDYHITSVQKNDRDDSLYFSFESGKIGRYKFDTHSLDYLDISLESAITNMSFSNDGSILATVREESVVQFWDLKTGTLLSDLTLRKGDFFEIDDIAFSGDGKYFFILGSDSILRVYAITSPDLAIHLNDSTTPAKQTPIPFMQVDMTFCQITDMGGINDQTFNTIIWQGMQKAENDFGVEIKYLESQQSSDYETNMNAFIAGSCDLIISDGFLLADTTEAAARANSEMNFAMVDNGSMGLDNVLGNYSEIQEATFLAGYLAAGMTKTGKVGTYTGILFPLTQAYLDGYAMGISYYNQVHETSVELYGYEINSQDCFELGNFKNIEDGRIAGEVLMDEGVDIIMPVAGPAGIGTLNAMQERTNVLFIGVDYDWTMTNQEQSDWILASIVKNYDIFVYDSIKSIINNEFAGGREYALNLQNNGVELVYGSNWESKIPSSLTNEIELIIPKIISGEILVIPER